MQLPVSLVLNLLTFLVSTSKSHAMFFMETPNFSQLGLLTLPAGVDMPAISCYMVGIIFFLPDLSTIY